MKNLFFPFYVGQPVTYDGCPGMCHIRYITLHKNRLYTEDETGAEHMWVKYGTAPRFILAGSARESLVFLRSKTETPVKYEIRTPINASDLHNLVVNWFEVPYCVGHWARNFKMLGAHGLPADYIEEDTYHRAFAIRFDTQDEGSIYVSRDMILQALSTDNADMRQVLADLLTGNDDVGTADLILQYAAFSEQRYC